MHNTEIRFVQYKTGKYCLQGVHVYTASAARKFYRRGSEGVHGSQGLGLEPNKDLI